LVIALSAMFESFTVYPMSSPIDPTPARVLVADDQPDVLEALRWLLTGEGYEPQFVSSTDGIMERLRDEPFDLLLMDLNYSRDTTSGREGLELIPRVRAQDPAMPIVVMTGWGSIDTAVAARRRDQRQQRELEDARLIQRGLLPTTLPQVEGINVAVAWQPAYGVGGDCFDTLAFGRALGVSIADIAGKGLPAALLMSNLQAAVRAFAQEASAPSSVCGNVNRLLCRNMASGRFATFFYARIEPDARRIVYSNAGHNPPLLVRADGSTALLSEGGMVLGIFPDNNYEQAEVTVGPGDRLVFYTDGITEARNPAGDEYGEDRLQDAALRAHRDSIEAMKDALLADVNQFTGEKFDDDATLIVVAIG
jgi:sigma-B regulation protein RsbU (phosphoserine phosphatase)